MKKAWRFIGTIIIIMLVLGAIAIGVGLLTGGSVERMVESYFGSKEAYELVKETIVGYTKEALSWN